MNKRRLASGKTGYDWVLPSWAKSPALRHGRDCPMATTSLGTERTGEPYSYGYMQKLFRRIRMKARLPAGMTFTGLRHGGLTEIDDSGADDVRAISGHRTLNVTAIYNKASQEKARKIAAKRREHIALVTAGEDGGS